MRTKTDSVSETVCSVGASNTKNTSCMKPVSLKWKLLLHRKTPLFWTGGHAGVNLNDSYAYVVTRNSAERFSTTQFHWKALSVPWEVGVTSYLHGRDVTVWIKSMESNWHLARWGTRT
jgi:hypothetical protein